MAASFPASQDAPALRGGPQRLPSLGPWEAVRRHPILALAPLVALVAAAIVLGLQRSPTYTAQTKLNVGGINLANPGALSGFSSATEALSEAYSRAIGADGVVDPLARRLGMTPGAVRNRTSATPIPQSPVFNVEATGDSAADAVRLANMAGDALIGYLNVLSSRHPDADRLLRSYQRAAARHNAAEAEMHRLQADSRVSGTAPDPEKLVAMQTKVDRTGVTAAALQQAYSVAQQGQSSTERVQVLTRASSATSDRRSVLQLLGFIGLVSGAALGTALALLVSRWELRRLQNPTRLPT